MDGMGAMGGWVGFVGAVLEIAGESLAVKTTLRGYAETTRRAGLGFKRNESVLR